MPFADRSYLPSSPTIMNLTLIDRLLVILLFSVFTFNPVQAQVLVDDFTDDHATPAFGTSTATDLAILGGEREVDNTTNSFSVQSSDGQFSAVMNFFESVRFVYDGTDESVEMFNHEGLGSLDLAATSDAFIITDIWPTGSGVAVDVALYTDATRASYATRVIGTPLDPVDLVIPFTTFMPLIGEGVDFSNVGAIELVVRSQGQTLVSFDRFGFNDTPLPVELVHFTALQDGQDLLLQWETKSELNNAGFFIEHEPPGEQGFAEVAFVEGRGTTDERQLYSYRMDVIENGHHTFRLRQVDFDGTTEYSAPVSIDVVLVQSYSLSGAYPNPFNPYSTFELSVQRDQAVRVTLHDIMGREVSVLFDGQMQQNAQRVVEINGTGLPSGTYIYRVVGEFFQTSGRVLLVK